MRIRKDGKRYIQDLSPQKHPGCQRLPPMQLLAANVQTQRHTLAMLRDSAAYGDCVTRKIDIVLAAMEGLIKAIEAVR